MVPAENELFIDVEWEVTFQQIEASISVIMVSIIAFPSLLGLKTLKSCERVWSWNRQRFLFRKGYQNLEIRGDRDSNRQSTN